MSASAGSGSTTQFQFPSAHCCRSMSDRSKAPCDTSPVRRTPRRISESQSGSAAGFTWADLPHHPVRLALVFVAPLALCWLIARHPLRLAEFALAYAGIVTFAALWAFGGSAHHHGILFLGADRHGLAGPRAERKLSLVGIGVAFGLDGQRRWRRTDAWLRNASVFARAQRQPMADRKQSDGCLPDRLARCTGLQHRRLSGPAPSTIWSASARAPSSYWNDRRQSPLSAEQFRIRLSSALDAATGRPAILIRNRPLAADELPADIAARPPELLQSFTGAETEENFWIYRVKPTLNILLYLNNSNRNHPQGGHRACA